MYKTKYYEERMEPLIEEVDACLDVETREFMVSVADLFQRPVIVGLRSFFDTQCYDQIPASLLSCLVLAIFLPLLTDEITYLRIPSAMRRVGDRDSHLMPTV